MPSKQPEKWKETIDPFSLPTQRVKILEVLGYPYAANQVFYVKGLYEIQEGHFFIKVAGHDDSNLSNEARVLSALHFPHTPTIVEKGPNFLITKELEGERLSTIVGDNAKLESLSYLGEFGSTLAELHQQVGDFPEAPHRRFHELPKEEKLKAAGLGFVYDYLATHQPDHQNRCFVHGDCHYANLLWKEGHISGILDFELAGYGSKEFDIAWSLILRPDQRFMKSEAELETFLKGYREVGSYEEEIVHYDMVLIYARFVFMGSPDYQAYVKAWLAKNAV